MFVGTRRFRQWELPLHGGTELGVASREQIAGKSQHAAVGKNQQQVGGSRQPTDKNQSISSSRKQSVISRYAAGNNH